MAELQLTGRRTETSTDQPGAPKISEESSENYRAATLILYVLFAASNKSTNGTYPGTRVMYLLGNLKLKVGHRRLLPAQRTRWLIKIDLKK